MGIGAAAAAAAASAAAAAPAGLERVAAKAVGSEAPVTATLPHLKCERSHKGRR